MRLLVIGSTGQLGSDFMRFADELDYQAEGIEYPDIDLADPASIERALADRTFDVVVNTAAYHAQDAYKDETTDRYYAINVFGPFHLARVAAQKNAVVATYSSDYVFSGNDEPSGEGFTETDLPIPANLYSASKLAGENLLRVKSPGSFIFRVASLYGHEGCKAKNRSNFVEMVISKLSAGEPMKIVNDIRMSPTSTESVVRASARVFKKGDPGLYHMAGAGSCTWYEFAQAAAEMMNLPLDLLTPSNSTEVVQEIKRGNNTALVNARLKSSGIGDLDHWRKHLQTYITGRPTPHSGQE